ncbi:hypothetical protein TCAL_06624 [Tigriopus californicus]|uniref:Chitin-binding type-2 domain-containing protein n=2 Tax=Tigriopus californicus TaxID=6832 RepID=A0A553PK37_TIGCA|nr:uncharacterized protein LOC131890807 isoform X2 [Tigriopus californicus]XP_059096216.1 uncharacterized protein LOC131890807 isoform X2 [Tigriopus californicus]XP_059096217.1 uncharacterized protein LOC131890807 isoform X2 [Tigriopus californicus]TRY78044.1 hypothetical protein TCAL_06624 [Tigriopus californicus]
MKTLFVFSMVILAIGAKPQGEPEGTTIQPIQEEQEDVFVDPSCYSITDCPNYHFCFFNAFGPNFCTTNLKEKVEAISCVAKNDDGEYPDHSICRKEHAERRRVTEDESPSRCYSELGYKCASAYHLPCTPNYDKEGKVIEGEELSCPNQFTCEERKYKDGKDLKVCIPVEPATRSSTCKTAPDCGFSVEENDWSLCAGGICRRVVQK